MPKSLMRPSLACTIALTVAGCGDDPTEPEEAARPDLVVASIGAPEASCPGGPGTCVFTVEVLVENAGDGDASAFTFRTTFDPDQSVVVDQTVSGGLPASLARRFEITTPPGDNCYDPDCTISVVVDSENDVVESDETNNMASQTTPG